MVNCECGFPVARRTSWTHENPGRKFIACKFFNHDTGHRVCKTFEWVDEDILDWQRDVANVLIAEKHRLATENHILKARLTCVEHEKCRIAAELEKLKKKKYVRLPHNSGVATDNQQGVVKFVVCVSVIVSVVVSIIFGKLFG